MFIFRYNFPQFVTQHWFQCVVINIILLQATFLTASFTIGDIGKKASTIWQFYNEAVFTVLTPQSERIFTSTNLMYLYAVSK